MGIFEKKIRELVKEKIKRDLEKACYCDSQIEEFVDDTMEEIAERVVRDWLFGGGRSISSYGQGFS